MSDILAADYYVSNARLMEVVAKLWIKPTDWVCDPTFGNGGFWKRFKPERLCATDLIKEKSPWHKGVDFRKMPWPDEQFDVVVFDPAYVTPGGRATSTIPEMNEAYGMDTAAPTLDAQWDVILDGMTECWRVLKPGGIFMQKVMKYISSGSYQNLEFDVLHAMSIMGLRQVDEFMLVKRSSGPQPKGRTRKCPNCRGVGIIAGAVVEAVPDDPGLAWSKSPDTACVGCSGSGRIATVQQHSRNNVSFLIVARKPK